MPLLEFTDRGIYCRRANVYIDPWESVDYALITHGHADHSSCGNKHYLCHDDSVEIIKYRLGADISIESFPYREEKSINGVKFSLFPAGHIIGSAQVRVEHKGEVWVVSGDYKLEDDGISTPFEAVKCNVFITECTFGLPIYKWKPQEEIFEDINTWWAANALEGKATILTGYSLGKAQRIIKNLDGRIGKVLTHGAIENMNSIIRRIGFSLPQTKQVTADINKDEFKGSIIIAPPSALGTVWQKKFSPFEVGIASGWMNLRGPRRRRSVDRGFALSDHADWVGLLNAIKSTSCEKVIATHGYTSIFSAYLNSIGIESVVETTEFEGELSEIGEGRTEKVEEEQL